MYARARDVLRRPRIARRAARIERKPTRRRDRRRVRREVRRLRRPVRRILRRLLRRDVVARRLLRRRRFGAAARVRRRLLRRVLRREPPPLRRRAARRADAERAAFFARRVRAAFLADRERRALTHDVDRSFHFRLTPRRRSERVGFIAIIGLRRALRRRFVRPMRRACDFAAAPNSLRRFICFFLRGGLFFAALLAARRRLGELAPKRPQFFWTPGFVVRARRDREARLPRADAGLTYVSPMRVISDVAEQERVLLHQAVTGETRVDARGIPPLPTRFVNSIPTIRRPL